MELTPQKEFAYDSNTWRFVIGVILVMPSNDSFREDFGVKNTLFRRNRKYLRLIGKQGRILTVIQIWIPYDYRIRLKNDRVLQHFYGRRYPANGVIFLKFILKSNKRCPIP